ncbi:MAG: manganese-binding transcriptional regulator MntR [Mariniblastus sp.]|nr:manganese-binding transcriptional regulator MntR [Mariniblastus sp.]
MADPKSPSTPHRRTRNDHATETAEDYVEAVADIINSKDSCRVGDLAKKFAVSHVTVSRIIRRLQAEGLVDTTPYQPIQLTSRGKRLAVQSKLRHEIVHQFLLAIGVDETTATIDSEGIEHHVSPKTLRVMQRFVQRVDTKNP